MAQLIFDMTSVADNATRIKPRPEVGDELRINGTSIGIYLGIYNMTLAWSMSIGRDRR